MNKAKELKTTTNIVKYILETYPQARNSDSVLYYKVLEFIGENTGADVSTMSVPMLLLHAKEYQFPCFETVGRCRRKIVQHHPELAGCRAVEAQRTVNEDIYKEYAKKVNV